VTDADYGDQEFQTLKGIDHSIPADPKTAKALPVGAHDGSLERVIAKGLDG